MSKNKVKKAKPKGKPKDNAVTTKFNGNGKVKLPNKFLHFGLVELKRGRTAGWQKIFKWGNTTLTMMSPQSLNMYDKWIMYATMQLFADAEKGLVKIDKWKLVKDSPTLKETDKNFIERKGKPDAVAHNMAGIASEYYKFVGVEVNFNEFCRKYARASRSKRQNVIDSLERWLMTKTIQKETTESGRTILYDAFHYIIDFKIRDDKCSIVVSQQLIDLCKNGLMLSFDTFHGIKTEIAKQLYLMWVSNQNQTFSYITIKNALGLSGKDWKNNQLIRQGLAELQEYGFIKSFNIKNEGGNTLYSVEYKILDTDKDSNGGGVNGEAVATAVNNRASGASVPDGVQSVPDGVQSVPDGVQSVPDGVQSVPDGVQGV